MQSWRIWSGLCVALGACASGGPEAEVALPRFEVEDLVAAPVDTVLGAVRDISASDSGLWIAASGSTPLAYYRIPFDGAPRYPSIRTTGRDPVRSVLSLDSDSSGAAVLWDGQSRKLLRVLAIDSVETIAAGPALEQMLQTPGWDFLGGKRNQVLSLRQGQVIGLLGQSRAGSGDFDRTALARVSPTAVVDTVLSLKEAGTSLDSALIGARLFGPFPLVARCGRERVAVYSPITRRVTLYDSLWKPAGSVQVALEPMTRTNEMARELFIRRMVASTIGQMSVDQIRRHVEGAPVGALQEASKRIPAYSRMICTDSGRLLMERFSIGRAGTRQSTEWEVHTPGSVPVLITLPTNFRLFDGTDQILVGVVTDSLDTPSVAFARWPKGTH